MRIIPALNELEDGESCFALSLEAMLDEQLALERRVEALAHRIVVAVANRTHRRTDTRFATALAEGDRGVLAALIGVVNDVRGPTPIDRHIESVQDEFGAQVAGHCPADDAAAEDIEYDGQEQKARPSGNVRDVGNPQLVRHCRHEVALNEIWRRLSITVSDRRAEAFAAAGP
jgi:hypothetical protein